MKISICTATYGANGHQTRLLKRLWKSICEQSYDHTQIEWIVSDQDALPEGEDNIAELEKSDISIKYLAFEDDSGISAHNTNNALDHATGEYVVILNHDDFFYHENALRDMVAALDGGEKGWVASACLHTDDYETKLERLHVPGFPGVKNLVEGVNRIGCPSVVMFKRELEPRCDPDIVYAMDCDLYIQLFHSAGEPAIIQSPNVVIRMWASQFTNDLGPAQLEKDKVAMRAKYGV